MKNSGITMFLWTNCCIFRHLSDWQTRTRPVTLTELRVTQLDVRTLGVLSTPLLNALIFQKSSSHIFLCIFARIFLHLCAISLYDCGTRLRSTEASRKRKLDFHARITTYLMTDSNSHFWEILPAILRLRCAASPPSLEILVRRRRHRVVGAEPPHVTAALQQ